MEYRKIKDQDKEESLADIEDPHPKPGSGCIINKPKIGIQEGSEWKRKSLVTIALTVLTSSQGILIAWSKRAGKYDYSITTVETLKCALSLIALTRTWEREGITEDNKLYTTLEEVKVYPIPAALYLIKICYRLTEIQWSAYILLCIGCTTAELTSSSDRVLQTPLQGWMMAIVMALLSGFAGVYTENFWLYIFGMIFNVGAMLTQDYDNIMNKGFFHGYSLITVCMIINHALSGIAVSMVMKYADNIVKVYSTSVAMLLTAFISMILFGFHLSLPFVLGSMVVSVSVYLHSKGKAPR